MMMRQERSFVEIDLKAFEENISFLKGFLSENQSFLQVVKADAYGHGGQEIAKAAEQMGAVYLGVANLEEGKVLRLQKIKSPILILSPSLSSEIEEIVRYELSPAISDLGFAKALNDFLIQKKQSIKVHIKVDSGMHRSGVRIEEALAFIEELKTFSQIEIEGIFSHFSSAESDSKESHRQEKAFEELIGSLKTKPKFIHLSNSSAISKGYAPFCNLVRFGILSFGVDTTGEFSDKLKPVMTFKSTLSQIKEIKKGEYVGYNQSYKAAQDGLYGIIPVGYADGYDFMLSNRGFVEYKGQLSKVIGKVSMDMITMEIDPALSPCTDDIVILLGGAKPETRAENLAALYNGSAYELLCQVGRRARRFYLYEDKLLHSAPLARRDFVAEDFGDSKLSRVIGDALAQRLKSEEIGSLIYREVLRTFFINKDRDIHYRKDFKHHIELSGDKEAKYFIAETVLTYRKVLDSDYFIVACAASDEILRAYFLKPDVEYRWLLDKKLDISSENFELKSVKINDIQLNTELVLGEGFLEIRCSHQELENLKGTEAEFEIITKTLYPKDTHQLSVFISEITRGVQISLKYPAYLNPVEPVSIFSGQQKNPQIQRLKDVIRLSTKSDEWVFPLSGVVFTY